MKGIFYPKQLKRISTPSVTIIKKIHRFNLKDESITVTFQSYPKNFYAKIFLSDYTDYRMSKPIRLEIKQFIADNNIKTNGK